MYFLPKNEYTNVAACLGELGRDEVEDAGEHRAHGEYEPEQQIVIPSPDKI